MDIIAYGQAKKEMRRVEEMSTLLGPGVKGEKNNLQERIDALVDSLDDVTLLADRLIVQEAINLVKAEARLNSIIQAKKYEMKHMFFDDLLDLSGIDTIKSKGYSHDAIKGEVSMSNGTLQTKASAGVPSMVIPVIESIGQLTLSIIVDGDESKKQIVESEKKTYIEQALQEGANIALRIEGQGIVTSVSLIWT